MQERIALLEKMVEELDKVTDKSSMDQAWPTVKELSARLTSLNEEFQALPDDLKQKANTSTLARKMQEVTARLTTAKTRAHQASIKPG